VDETNEARAPGGVSTVLAHLVHAEHDDWMPRANVILHAGQSQRFRLPTRRYVRFKQGKSLAELLDDFAEVRAQNLEALRAFNLTPTDLERRGHHPAFGEVTLSQLLAIGRSRPQPSPPDARIMAVQYARRRSWTRFLGVMQCAGHSAAA